MPSNVAGVVKQGLCTGCGTCVVACPRGSIAMRETAAGLLLPHISTDCTECGRCVLACPGWLVDLKLCSGASPFEGEVREAYVGCATMSTVRAGGTSGGLVSALLLSSLDSRRADVALTAAAGAGADGTLRPAGSLARGAREVLTTQGSKYSLAATNAALLGVCDDERVAAVGLPCHVHGIRKLAAAVPSWRDRVAVTIGLLCDRSLLRVAADVLADAAGLDFRDVASVDWRYKGRRGWPGEVRLHLRSGEDVFYPKAFGTVLKDLVTPPRCRICFDKMNILADISIGDPWGMSDSRAGESVALVRTERGAQFLQEAVDGGYVRVTQIDQRDVFEGQGLAERMNAFAAYSRAWKEMGRVLPSYMSEGEVEWPQCGPQRLAPYRRRLELNRRLSEGDNRQWALAAIRRHRQVNQIRRALGRARAKVLRRLGR